MTQEVPAKCAVADHRIKVLEGLAKQHHEEHLEMMKTVAGSYSKLEGIINAFHGHLDRCRNEIRAEIDRDFVKQPEFVKLKAKVETLATSDQVINLKGDMRVMAVKVGALVSIITLIGVALIQWVFKTKIHEAL